MNTKTYAVGALSGLILTAGLAGTLSAQSAAEALGVSEEQAIELALAEVEGTVEEVELDRHRGVQYYEVEMVTADGQEVEIEINAASGEIIEVDYEDGHDCNRDRDDAEEA